MILETIKSYALAGIILILLLMAIALQVTRFQRNTARLQVKERDHVIEGYRLAGIAAKGQVERAKAKAIDAGVKAQAVVSELVTTLPTNDEEARQWAIKAAGRIGQ